MSDEDDKDGEHHNNTILTVDEKIKVADVKVMHRNNTPYNDNLFAIPTPISFYFMATTYPNHLGEHSEPMTCDLQQVEFLATKIPPDNPHDIFCDLTYRKGIGVIDHYFGRNYHNVSTMIANHDIILSTIKEHSPSVSQLKQGGNQNQALTNAPPSVVLQLKNDLEHNILHHQ